MHCTKVFNSTEFETPVPRPSIIVLAIFISSKGSETLTQIRLSKRASTLSSLYIHELDDIKASASLIAFTQQLAYEDTLVLVSTMYFGFINKAGSLWSQRLFLNKPLYVKIVPIFLFVNPILGLD
ncbi:hypothetical protein PanWU01x14_025160 [Parasponia andersonii]|uniref:Uncharacterized protein n=1 Tax=Parasponia andersonii TaxID=3476 RepID=A0A2P5DWV0_PARAD|nr:hypothetical protein PanWU01x14_025160 [Parasponia andersonii]